MENRAFGVLAAALLLCGLLASTARSEPLRVLYAEPFEAQTLQTPGAQKTAHADLLRVRAFGRTFELQLEDNSRLLRGASAQTRQRFGAIRLGHALGQLQRRIVTGRQIGLVVLGAHRLGAAETAAEQDRCRAGEHRPPPSPFGFGCTHYRV